MHCDVVLANVDGSILLDDLRRSLCAMLGPISRCLRLRRSYRSFVFAEGDLVYVTKAHDAVV